MEARFDSAQSVGCDAIYPDNLNGYENDSGFNLTYQDQITYNTWIASLAHARDMAVGLADIGQIADLQNLFDFVLIESCFYFNECSLLSSFLQTGKAVLSIEYKGNPQKFCKQANAMGMSTLKMNVKLNGKMNANCTDPKYQ